MKKRISALVLSAVMIVGTVGVSAQYPEHNNLTIAFQSTQYPMTLLNGGSISEFVERWIDTTRTQYDNYVIKETSDEDYVFEVDGRRFVMLDTDEEGNYFIGADETYGKKWFNSWTRGSDEDYMAAYTGDWRYDPERTTNVGYWLNDEENGFLATGNGGKIFPQSIIDNLVEKDWVVEGGDKISEDAIWQSSQIKNLVSNPTQQYTSLDSYTVRQKVSLMSLTEYVAYSDIFSPRPYDVPIDTTDWTLGWMLRTPSNAPITLPSIQSCLYLTGQKGGGTATLSRLDNSTGHQVSVRPVFWLDSDFFGNNPIDTDGTSVKAGAKVIENIKSKYIKSDLESIYDESVLINGFGYPEFGPLPAQGLIVKGNLAAGEILSASYDYAYEEGGEVIPEGESKYQWYISNDSGEFTAIAGETSKTIEADEDMIGKKLKVSVRCIDANGNSAATVMSGETGAIRESQPIKAALNNFTFESGASFTVDSTADGTAIVLIGIYDEENKLISMDMKNVELIQGSNEISIGIPEDGASAKAFLISDIDSMRPYIMAEISK